MKKIAVLAALLAVFVGCKTQSKKTEQTKPTIEYITGELSYFAVQDDIVLLPVDSALTRYDVRLYQGEEGLMLESPVILTNTLFGIKSTTGFSDRIKEGFTYIGKQDSLYQYGIPYCDMEHYFATYYIQNLDYCWVVYTQEGRANEVDMIEFSPAEFGKYFDNVKAHYMN